MTPILLIATLSMLLQQAFSYCCNLVMPILATEMAIRLGVNHGLLSVYQALTSFAAIIAANACGSFILRYGALRMSQLALVMLAISVCLASLMEIWLLPVAALLLGMGSVSTPASSHILARFSPPRLAPLVFSIKQTGVPVGSLIAGFLVPVFYASYGLSGAFIAVACVGLTVVVALQPLRRPFDDDRQPGRPLSPGDIRNTLLIVIRTPALRALAFTALSLGGMQAVFTTFYVSYLRIGLGHSLEVASSSFAIAGGIAIVTRILWGWLAGGRMPARAILAILCLGGAASSVAVGFFAPHWPVWLLTSIAILYNATAISWHGILLAEVARLAPPGTVGQTTGGVLSFTSFAMMTYPLAYWAALHLLEDHGAGFLLAAVPAAIVGLTFLRPAPAQLAAR
jgi:hypothetical protein